LITDFGVSALPITQESLAGDLWTDPLYEHIERTGFDYIEVGPNQWVAKHRHVRRPSLDRRQHDVSARASEHHPYAADACLAGIALRRHGETNFSIGGGFSRWMFWSVVFFTLPRLLGWFPTFGVPTALPPCGIGIWWMASAATDVSRGAFLRLAGGSRHHCGHRSSIRTPDTH
jgi:hypothetical protein